MEPISATLTLAAIFSGVFGGKKIFKSKKRKEDIEKKLKNAITIHKSNNTRTQNELIKFETKLDRYGKRKLEVASTTYLTAVKFLKKVKNKKVSVQWSNKDTQKLEKTISTMENINIGAKNILADISRGALGGFATANGVYATVGAFGAGAGLHGAAATSSTMAWFGGGSLATGGGGMAAGAWSLTGLFAGPSLLITSVFIDKKVNNIEQEINKNINKMVRKNKEWEIERELYRHAYRNTEEVWNALNILNRKLLCFLKKSDPSNDEDAYMVYTLCKGIMSLLEVKIVLPNGKINEEEFDLQNLINKTNLKEIRRAA